MITLMFYLTLSAEVVHNLMRPIAGTMLIELVAVSELHTRIKHHQCFYNRYRIKEVEPNDLSYHLLFSKECPEVA